MDDDMATAAAAVEAAFKALEEVEALVATLEGADPSAVSGADSAVLGS